MDTEPYISTVDEFDKFLEEMDTETTEPVTPKKSNKVCHLYVQFINKEKYVKLYFKLIIIFLFIDSEEFKRKIAAMYKPNW